MLVGFSGGAAFAGGLVLDHPDRYQGAAILYGTLPFDAGLHVEGERLRGLPVLVIHGDDDNVIPAELQACTWSYLHAEAGSDTTGVRTPGGHGINAAALHEIQMWLGTVTASEKR